MISIQGLFSNPGGPDQCPTSPGWLIWKNGPLCTLQLMSFLTERYSACRNWGGGSAGQTGIHWSQYAWPNYPEAGNIKSEIYMVSMWCSGLLGLRKKGDRKPKRTSWYCKALPWVLPSCVWNVRPLNGVVKVLPKKPESLHSCSNKLLFFFSLCFWRCMHVWHRGTQKNIFRKTQWQEPLRYGRREEHCCVFNLCILTLFSVLFCAICFFRWWWGWVGGSAYQPLCNKTGPALSQLDNNMLLTFVLFACNWAGHYQKALNGF